MLNLTYCYDVIQYDKHHLENLAYDAALHMNFWNGCSNYCDIDFFLPYCQA